MAYAVLVRRFLLDDHKNPVEATGQQWLARIDEQSIVRVTTHGDSGVTVRTKFAGVDMRMNPTRYNPLLFETRVWGGALSGRTQLTGTYGEALEAHKLMVREVRKHLREVPDDD
jgi:hypothetical protein